MRRRETGRYEPTAAGGERVRAFVPAPLPPKPRLRLDGPLSEQLESATLALGRLDSVSALLPDEALFIYSYVRKEAVLSSQIEGTQSSLSDLLLFETGRMPGVPRDDVLEVSNYVAALDHGLGRLEEGFPLSNRLIREVHGVLLSTGGNAQAAPGHFRRSQNWIGSSRPGNAVFVPPPHTAVQDCMADLERFLHAAGDGIPTLVRAGLAHVQFETIHPFLDGNGRVGRLLVALLLSHAGVLRQPLLYLSLFLKQHRQEYYRLLDHVRQTGDWEAWLAFFLEGVETTAEGAVETARQLHEIFRRDYDRISAVAERRTGSTLQVHEALKAKLVVSIRDAANITGLTFPTVSRAMQLLVERGIAREVTGASRNRLYVYGEYMEALNEGVDEPPA